MSYLGTFRNHWNCAEGRIGRVERVERVERVGFLVNCGHLGCLGDFVGREAATDPGDKSSTSADQRMFNISQHIPKFYQFEF